MVPDTLNLSLDQLKKLSQQFKRELLAAQVGEPSSLSFLSQPRPKTHELHGLLQVVSIGGTNLHSGLVSSSSAGYSLGSFTHQPLPQLNNSDQFITLIKSVLHPQAKYLALNLAFPLRPQINQGLPDGILLRGTKEHDFKGMIGQSLVSVLAPHLPSITLSVGNDASCLALAATPLFPAPAMALVLGTGFNLAFSHDEQIVNIEAGRFNQLPQAPLDRLLDHSSQAPGTQILEKQVAGGYLASLFNLYAFPLNLPQVSTTSQLASLTQSHPGYQLAQALFLRSASLVSASLCGYADFVQTHQLNLLAEGSLFWSPQYSSQVKSLLEKLNRELKLNLKQLPHSGLIGAARMFLPDQEITF